jgi:hypothetical protein
VPADGSGSGGQAGGATGTTGSPSSGSSLVVQLRRAPKQALLKKGKLLVFASCSQACSLSLPGVALVPGSKNAAKAKAVKLGTLNAKLAAGTQTKLTIKLGKARTAVLKTLLAHKRVMVTFRASAKGPDGGSASANLSFKLK